MIYPEDKIMTLEQADLWRKEIAANNKKLVLTNGCFDLLHRGHMQYLTDARKEGDYLIVAVNSDSSIRQLKGPERPIIAEEHRLYSLAALGAVDAVVAFEDVSALKVIETINPDIYVKGGDYTLDTLDKTEYQLIKTLGCQVTFIPFVKGLSTSLIVEKIKTGK